MHQLLFYEDCTVEDDELLRANKGLPKDSAAIDVNGLLCVNNSLPKDSNGQPIDSATVDDNGLPRANNGLTKDSAAFWRQQVAPWWQQGPAQRLSCHWSTPPVKSGFKGKCANVHEGLADMVVRLPVGGGHGVKDSNRWEGSRQWQVRPLSLNIMLNRGHAEVLPIFLWWVN